MGPEGGLLTVMKDSLFLLISNVLGRGCGVGRGTTNADEVMRYSLFLLFRKGVWGKEGAHK